jgi:hypothetical protein
MNCHQSLHLHAAKKMLQKKLWKIIGEQQPRKPDGEQPGSGRNGNSQRS